jgi:phage-related protein
MAKGGEVVFDFKGNDKDLQKTTKSATSTLKGMASTVSKTMLAMTATVATAFAGIVTASVKARGAIEQSIGGTKKIFDEINFEEIEKDAKSAYKTMNLSAQQYLDMINSVGATFASTMGDKKGYETAKKGLQAIADYASGTGLDVNLLNEKFKLITRSATQYITIADQFSGILPQTTSDFLKQAQSAGYLSKQYKKLTEVPVAEYQQAVSAMIEEGVRKQNLLGNTLAETQTTLTGSLNALKSSWQNFIAGLGGLDTVVESANFAFQNIMRILGEAVPYIINEISNASPQLLELGKNILTNIFNGIVNNLPKITEGSIQILKSLVDGLIKGAPQILQSGVQLIQQLVLGIAQEMPTLIPQAVECVVTLVEGLLDNIDVLVDAGIELIVGLSIGLIDALPRLIEKAPTIVEKLASAIVRNLPKIYVAGGQLIGKLVMGILGSIVKLVETAPKMISAIVRGLASWMGEMRNSGKNIVKGIWQGISGMGGWLYDKVRNFARNILNNMKEALGIHSPSTLFADIIGKNSALGIGVGFENEMGNVSKMMNASMLEFGDMFELSPSLNSTSSSTSNVNVTIHNNMETDFMGNLVNNIKTYSNGSKNDYNYGMAY